jgi:membrane-bound metal-dependent hydrolase YbcI (DUF457 family)
MPLPVAHGLLGASVAVGLRQSSRPRSWKLLLISFFLGICPDFDYLLNWLGISGGGWHHGFTHSLLFALFVGLVAASVVGERNARDVIILSGVAGSHTMLDLLMTESRGVALWWPFTDQRYKLSLPNPIDYTWSNESLREAAMDIFRISLIELMIFGAIFLAVVWARKLLTGQNDVI